MESATVTLTEYDAFLQGLRQVQVTHVAIDTETTGLRLTQGEDYCQGVSMAFRAGGMVFKKYFPFRHREGFNLDIDYARQLVEALASKNVIFHNRKFDFHSLATLGVGPWRFERAYDTMLMAHMFNENKPYEKSLDNCGKLYVGRGKTKKAEMDAFTDALGWGNVPSHLMAEYAEGDAEVTLELFEKLEVLCKRKFGDQWEELWDWDERFNDALFRMEQLGVHVDLKFCRQYQGIAEIEMAQIEDELGFQPSKTSQLGPFLFEELKLPVLEYTPAGKPKMDKNVMQEYDKMLEGREDERARLVLDYRGWQKASSAFYLPFQKLVDSRGKIHANFKQQGTVTGRLSCAEPNLQQIPRESTKVWNGRIRTAFYGTEGFSLFGFDYSQLELRLAAAYGHEEWLIQGFADRDFDPFETLAGRIGIIRQDAKTFTYSMIYGAGEDKVAKTMHKTVYENADNYAAYTKSVPGIMRVKQMAGTKCKQRGYVRYWTGRRRHLYPDDSYKAFNALLQGGGAEVVKRVMVTIAETVCDENCRLVLQVHDELVFEIRDGMYAEYAPRIIAAMEALPLEVFGFPFYVDGKHWGKE